MDLFEREFDEHMAVAAASQAALGPHFGACWMPGSPAFAAAARSCSSAMAGSAGDAQHLATELTSAIAKDRAPIAAIALTTDSSAMTAAGNDLGFERIFSRQIEALGRQGDIALGISTSGRSPNVILALETAKQMGLVAAALGGRRGGRLPGLADPLLLVPPRTATHPGDAYHPRPDALRRAGAGTGPGMSADHLWSNASAAARVLVLGDVMLDRYVYGSVDRMSPEAPVPVLRQTSATRHGRRCGQCRPQYCSTRRQGVLSAWSATMPRAASCRHAGR